MVLTVSSSEIKISLSLSLSLSVCLVMRRKEPGLAERVALMRFLIIDFNKFCFLFFLISGMFLRMESRKFY